MHGVQLTPEPHPSCTVASPEKDYSDSLPRGHGIPSSYTRLLGCDRLARAYNTVTERLPSSYSRTGCGHPLQWGAATSGVKRPGATYSGGLFPL